MKIIIIDDEPSAISVLKAKLDDYEEIEVAGVATNGERGLQLLKKEKPDALFLDVELPDMTGIEFLSLAGNELVDKCRVVMYTAHSKYMLPSFRNHAFDFLTKPIDEHELSTVVKRLLMPARQLHTATLEHTSIERRKDDKLLFYTNSLDFRLAHIRDIGFFQYNHEQRVWEMVLAGTSSPIKLKRSANNESLLTIDASFVQVSQRFIININYLLEVCDNICRFFPPFDKIDYVKVGRLYRKKLIEQFESL